MKRYAMEIFYGIDTVEFVTSEFIEDCIAYLEDLQARDNRYTAAIHTIH